VTIQHALPAATCPTSPSVDAPSDRDSTPPPVLVLAPGRNLTADRTVREPGRRRVPVVRLDPAWLRRFARRGPVVNGPSVMEAARRATVFTHLLDEADLADLRGVEITAHRFQRWVAKGYEVRVVVVGEDVFAAGIHAGSAETRMDRRAGYCDLAYSRPDLPDDVRRGLLRYCREFGLGYGAFDLVVTPDDGWVFLECDASGRYGWIEDATGAPITASIADLLVEGRAS
jgi:hypothetical protein